MPSFNTGFLRDDVTGALAITPASPMTPVSGGQALQIQPSGAVPASTSTGGAININNTSSTGAGMVIYSNQGAGASGRLLAVRVDNAAFPTQPVYIENHGNSHAMSINHQANAGDGKPTNGNALAITSTNPNDTTLGVSGSESGRGTIKVTHRKPNGVVDTNASAISINMSRDNAGETSDAQGIFMDSDHAFTGGLMNLRVNGVQKFSVTNGGRLTVVDGVTTKLKAGTPVDGDFAATPADGTIVADSTGSKIWVRLGGVWKGVVVA